MKYLERLKAAGGAKKFVPGGGALPKLTKPSKTPIPVLTEPTKPGCVSSAGAVPPTEKSCESEGGGVDLEARIHRMAKRWAYSAAELAQEIARAAADPAKALLWVERDEALFGKCVTLPDFATQYTAITQVADTVTAPLSKRQETARRDVLAQIEAQPTVKLAFVNRFEPDDTMVITLGIRDVGTAELKIPAERFNQDGLDDYGALLTIIGGAA